MGGFRKSQVSGGPVVEPGTPCAMSRMLRDFPVYFGRKSAGKLQS